MTIFSYGSNMHMSRIKKRVPSAKLIAVGYITQHQLRLHKTSKDGSAKADAFFTGNEDDVISGTIIEINEKEKPNLDQAEGLGYGYNEKEIDVFIQENETIKANIYIADESAINPKLKPYEWYKLYIVEGAKAANLPPTYQEKLNQIEFVKDTDETRRNKNFQILKSLTNE